MIAFISPAKTFAKKPILRDGIDPVFLPESHPIVEYALSLSSDELSRCFKISPKLAEETRKLWLSFVSETSQLAPALGYYAGMVFKKIDPRSFNGDDWDYAERHLRICSSVYGLLSPLSLIRPYRMEGSLCLPEGGQKIFDYWKPLMTERLISEAKAQDGVLICLASEEMQHHFDWAKLVQELHVITCHFVVRTPEGKLKNITVYAKMARGAMTRAMILQKMTRAEELQAVSPEGFKFSPLESDEHDWYFVLEQG